MIMMMLMMMNDDYYYDLPIQTCLVVLSAGALQCIQGSGREYTIDRSITEYTHTHTILLTQIHTQVQFRMSNQPKNFNIHFRYTTC